MFNQNEKSEENICSRVWIKPIKGSREGVEKIGLEMEMHAYDAETLAPFGTKDSQVDLQSFLKRVAEITPQSKIKYDEGTSLITDVFFKQGGNISVEPGGQLEYSSAPFEKISDLAENVINGLQIMEEAASGELVFLSHGTNPIAEPDHPLVLPKDRYKIMTRYFESAPHIRGIDMMRHSATVQANLDIFGDENWQDAVNLVLVLIPLTSGLFANSRYFKGKRSNYFSERQEIWKNMDPTRSGIPTDMPFAENSECAYAAWAKQANVFLVEGLPAHEQPLYGELSFERWLKNGYKGITPTILNWESHLATLFPHLRLRDFLEIRHIDAQPFEHTLAPVAFFSALTMCKKVRMEVWNLLKQRQVDLRGVFYLNQDYSSLYLPLLDFASHVLSQYKEHEGMRAIEAYKKFLLQKENYWNAESALDFVKKNITLNPSIGFQKNLL